MNVKKSKKSWVKELAEQGLKPSEIAKITGLSERTVYTYRSEMIPREYKEKTRHKVFTVKMQIEWTEAVNRIRKACGKEPFPIPEYT